MRRMPMIMGCGVGSAHDSPAGGAHDAPRRQRRTTTDKEPVPKQQQLAVGVVDAAGVVPRTWGGVPRASWRSAARRPPAGAAQQRCSSGGARWSPHCVVLSCGLGARRRRRPDPQRLPVPPRTAPAAAGGAAVVVVVANTTAYLPTSRIAKREVALLLLRCSHPVAHALEPLHHGRSARG